MCLRRHHSRILRLSTWQTRPLIHGLFCQFVLDLHRLNRTGDVSGKLSFWDKTEFVVWVNMRKADVWSKEHHGGYVRALFLIFPWKVIFALADRWTRESLLGTLPMCLKLLEPFLSHSPFRPFGENELQLRGNISPKSSQEHRTFLPAGQHWTALPTCQKIPYFLPCVLKRTKRFQRQVWWISATLLPKLRFQEELDNLWQQKSLRNDIQHSSSQAQKSFGQLRSKRQIKDKKTLDHRKHFCWFF